LPLIPELINKLKGVRIFTKLDLRWGYNNVRIKEEDQFKVAFIADGKLWELTVMFFGLQNSPATFQSMMNALFDDLIKEGWVIIYMDNILIFSKDLEEHCILVKKGFTAVGRGRPIPKTREMLLREIVHWVSWHDYQPR